MLCMNFRCGCASVWVHMVNAVNTCMRNNDVITSQISKWY
jgi:hypothetical protein